MPSDEASAGHLCKGHTIPNSERPLHPHAHGTPIRSRHGSRVSLRGWRNGSGDLNTGIIWIPPVWLEDRTTRLQDDYIPSRRRVGCLRLLWVHPVGLPGGGGKAGWLGFSGIPGWWAGIWLLCACLHWPPRTWLWLHLFLAVAVLLWEHLPPVASLLSCLQPQGSSRCRVACHIMHRAWVTSWPRASAGLCDLPGR